MNEKDYELTTKSIGMALSGTLCAWMLKRMYSVEGAALREFINALATDVFNIPGVNGMEFQTALFIGLVVTTLVFFAADWRNHYAGGVFALFLGFFLFVLAVLDLWLPNLPLTTGTVSGAIAGIGLAVAVQGNDAIQIIDVITKGENKKFPVTQILLPLLLLAVVVPGLIQALISGAAIPVIDIPAVGIFIWSIPGLVFYKRGFESVPYGEGQSGKTIVYVLLNRVIERSLGTARHTSEKVDELNRALDDIDDGDELDGDIIQTTNRTDRLMFTARLGGKLSPEVEFENLDIEGEWAGELSEMHKDWSITDSILAKYTSIRILLNRGDISTNEFQRYTVYRQRKANIVVHVLDMYSYAKSGMIGADYHKKVAQELDTLGVTQVVVAAKSDIFEEHPRFDDFDFDAVYDGLLVVDDEAEPLAPVADGGDMGENSAEVNDLADGVEEVIKNHSFQAETFLDLVDVGPIPTGIKMQSYKNSPKVDLDEDDQLQTFGFKQLSIELLYRAGAEDLPDELEEVND